MAENSVKYPIGVQSFEKIRKEGYLYIDKTELIYNLASRGSYYFLSRPRRFGKSLLLSTMKAYFEGRRELFEGLAISELEKDWEHNPVILLSLAGYKPGEKSIESVLDEIFSEFEAEYGIVNPNRDYGMRFRRIIRTISKTTGKNVVILVDEYDAPMVAHLGEPDRHEEVRNLLKSVYTNLKDMNDYIKFGFLTGVSKFSKMTIFSGLNNLNDISLLPQYAEICGITEKELRRDFQEGIAGLAETLKTDSEGVLQTLKENYDGYHFTEDCPDLYNPFSLLNAVNNRRIRPYWFESGSPTFLIKLLQEQKDQYWEIFNQEVPETSIAEIDTYQTNPASILFQTGYLTIKDFDPEYYIYTLGVPNKEVKAGLFSRLLASNIGSDASRTNIYMRDIHKAFLQGDPERALDIIRSVFAGIPPALSQGKPEIYYENNLYMLFMLVGLDARAEWWTSDGRIDMLLALPGYIYVMELKLDGSPEEALAQIDTKDYALQWKHDGRKIVKIGINFSKQTRNIDRWLIRS